MMMMDENNQVGPGIKQHVFRTQESNLGVGGGETFISNRMGIMSR